MDMSLPTAFWNLEDSNIINCCSKDRSTENNGGKVIKSFLSLHWTTLHISFTWETSKFALLQRSQASAAKKRKVISLPERYHLSHALYYRIPLPHAKLAFEESGTDDTLLMAALVVHAQCTHWWGCSTSSHKASRIAHRSKLPACGKYHYVTIYCIKPNV